LPERLIVNAPASSANLGPGFDCLAVALELRNQVEIRAAGGDATTVTADGEGASRLPPDPHDNLFVRAFTATGANARGLTIHMTNAVPFAKGLGSSAATIAAGVLAGLAWQGDDRDPFPLAVELEGHPDNVAAALYGGVQLSWKSARGPQTVPLGPAPVEFVAVIPPYELSTEQARAAIPPQVPLFDAVHTAARVALLVAAIEQGRAELLADALDDRLHEPYRAPLVPLLAAVRARLRDLPALGATLSGAGPTVLVWVEPGSVEAVAAGLEGVEGSVVRPLLVAAAGAGVDLIL
jgi:homoserine kinase